MSFLMLIYLTYIYCNRSDMSRATSSPDLTHGKAELKHAKKVRHEPPTLLTKLMERRSDM